MVKAYEEAAELASVDSAYSYTYIDVDPSTKALKETTYRLYAEKDPLTGEVSNTTFDANFANVTDADSLAAKVSQNIIDEIAKYNNGDLVDGKLLDDKKYLASFTTEVKALLDTLAAGAKVDTSYVDDIKAWSDTLAMYKNADKTLSTKETAVSTALGNITDFSKAASFDAYRKALIAYYEAAVANGAKLNKVPVQVKGAALVNGVATETSVTSLVEIATALGDATNGNANVKFLYDLNYGFMNLAAATDTTSIVYVGADGKNARLQYTTKAFSKEAMDDRDMLDALERASEKAFGDVDLYIDNFNALQTNCTVDGSTYLQVQPTEADIKALNDILGIDAYTSLGSYGKYLYESDPANIVYAKNYKSIMTNLEGAIAYWEAKYAILKAKLEAQKAAEAAAALAMNKYYIENISNAQDKADDAQDEIDDINPIIGALDDLIDVYLPAWAKQNGTSQLGDYSTAQDAFKKALNNIIALKQASVRRVERKLAAAKVALELSTTEYCSAFNVAEADLNKAIADLEDAQAGLDKALAEMAKALEIIAALDAE